ncbi:MAG: cysteine desulfurase family protein [Chloroflexota bacterium]
MDKRVYMDHAATTPTDPRVVESMLTYFTNTFGNPSSVHGFGQEARKAVDESHETVAHVLGCAPQDVVFTSGGTESDNIAIKGAAHALRQSGDHIITSTIEHHAVLHSCQQLERMGFKVTYLAVDKDGLVRLDDLERALTDRTTVVSIMMANNEIGTIEPVHDIVRVVKDRAKKVGHPIVVHTDAVQAWMLDLDVGKLGVDMLSLAAHKFFGPKGVGVLYFRKGTPFLAQQVGGGHERRRRAGTENVPGMVGAATALRLAAEGRESISSRCRMLRDRLMRGVFERVPGARLNGHPAQRLPHNAHFSFDGAEGESMVMGLDLRGIACSTGSACNSASPEPSHVLLGIGLTTELAAGSLRFTVGPENTEAEVDYVLDTLTGVISRLRSLAPQAPRTR